MVGDQALALRRDGMEVTPAFDSDGLVANWEAYEGLLSHAYTTGVQAAAADYAVMYAEPTHACVRQRERIGELLFEAHGAPALAVSPAVVLAAYANGRHTGVVLDVGDAATTAAPVLDGTIARHLVLRTRVAGRSLSAAVAAQVTDARIPLRPLWAYRRLRGEAAGAARATQRAVAEAEAATEAAALTAAAEAAATTAATAAAAATAAQAAAEHAADAGDEITPVSGAGAAAAGGAAGGAAAVAAAAAATAGSRATRVAVRGGKAAAAAAATVAADGPRGTRRPARTTPTPATTSSSTVSLSLSVPDPPPPRAAAAAAAARSTRAAPRATPTARPTRSVSPAAAPRTAPAAHSSTTTSVGGSRRPRSSGELWMRSSGAGAQRAAVVAPPLAGAPHW